MSNLFKDISSVVNDFYTEKVGMTVTSLDDLQNVIDTGNVNPLGSTEMFFDEMYNRLIKVMTAGIRELNVDQGEDFYVDSEYFGAILEVINVEPLEAHKAMNYEPITSGVTTMGSYPIYKPDVHAATFGSVNGYQIEYAISEDQIASAFTNASEMMSVLTKLAVNAANSIKLHRKNLNDASICNLIAEKHNAQAAPSIDGIHEVNLVAEYAKRTGKTSLTVTDFINDPLALIDARRVMADICDQMSEPSVLFNSANYLKWTAPNDRVFYVNAQFARMMETIALSDIYNPDKVSLPPYKRKVAWQSINKSFAFEDTTTVKVKTSSDGTTTEVPFVVGLVADKLAIMHTVKNERTFSMYFQPENVRQYYYQFADMRCNNLTENACIFILADYTG